jgi:hypothetical protein
MMADNPAVLGTPVSLFHTATGVAYADLEIDQHRETWPIRSKQFRAWLRRRHYERTGEAMGLATISSILDLLEGRPHLFGSRGPSLASCGGRTRWMAHHDPPAGAVPARRRNATAAHT